MLQLVFAQDRGAFLMQDALRPRLDVVACAMKEEAPDKKAQGRVKPDEASTLGTY